MYISEVKLRAFKMYQDATFLFPEPKEGKNIVLIGGMNGSGKTCLLEAIYLCLYGEDAPNYLEKAGLKDPQMAYKVFLYNAFNIENRSDGTTSMSVTCTINKHSRMGYRIERKWIFRNNQFKDTEVKYTEIVGGNPGKSKSGNDISIRAAISEVFVPVNLSNFFIFDGERIKNMAENDDIREVVNEGLEKLIGVDLLNDTRKRLEDFIESKLKSSPSIKDNTAFKQNLRQVEDDKENAEYEFNEINKTIDDLKDELTITIRSKEGYFDHLKSRGGAGVLSETKELEEDKSNRIIERKELQKELEINLVEKLPQMLVDYALKDLLQNHLINDEEYQRVLNFSNNHNDFMQIFNQTASIFPFNPELSLDNLNIIKKRIEFTWNKLNQNSESIIHPSPIFEVFSSRDRNDVLSSLSKFSINLDRVEEILFEEDKLNRIISELESQISKSGEFTNDAKMREYNDKYNHCLVKEKDLMRQIAEAVENREKTYQQLKTLESDFKRLKLENEEHIPTLSLIKKAEKVISTIDSIKKQLFDTKLSELSMQLAYQLKKLMHKQKFIETVDINQDGLVTIYDSRKERVSLDRSAGENQIFATALLAALMVVSGKKAPLIVDTPLSRLDSLHRENLFEFWTSTPDRQVILLLQNTEIDQRLYNKIADKIGAVYLLKHEEREGSGVTKPLHNHFFREINR